VIDALARLQLAAIECGRRIRLHTTDPALLALLELFGLTEALRCGEPEKGEQSRIEENVHPDQLAGTRLEDLDSQGGK